MDFKIPQQSIIYLMVCISGMLILVFLGIVPSQKTLTKLDKEIAEKKSFLEAQKTLSPLYQTLTNKIDHKAPWSLPFPQRTNLSRTGIDAVRMQVGEIAGKTKVKMISLSPNIDSLANNYKYLALEAIVQGNFSDFRRFLIGLGGLVYIENIVEMQMTQNAKAMEFKIKFRITRS